MGNYVHGYSTKGAVDPLYSIWRSMRDRCKLPTHQKWKDYGGRGITVCEEWDNDLLTFIKDMGPRPEGYTLYRIDNSGNYCKENCRWTDSTTQQLNRRMGKNNTSGVKGVHFVTSKQKWRACGQLWGDNETLYFGESFEEACDARKAWEVKYGVSS